MLEGLEPALGLVSAELVALIALGFGAMFLFFSGSAVLVLGSSCPSRASADRALPFSAVAPSGRRFAALAGLACSTSVPTAVAVSAARCSAWRRRLPADPPLGAGPGRALARWGWFSLGSACCSWPRSLFPSLETTAQPALLVSLGLVTMRRSRALARSSSPV